MAWYNDFALIILWLQHKNVLWEKRAASKCKNYIDLNALVNPVAGLENALLEDEGRGLSALPAFNDADKYAENTNCRRCIVPIGKDDIEIIDSRKSSSVD